MAQAGSALVASAMRAEAGERGGAPRTASSTRLVGRRSGAHQPTRPAMAGLHGGRSAPPLNRKRRVRDAA
jgi:hypothetical protein